MADLVEPAEDAAAAAAAPQPEPKPEPATLEEYIREESPYPKERADKLKAFYKKRGGKNGAQYTYLEDGHLVILGKDGEQKEVLTLKTYVPYDAATWATRDQARADVLSAAETAYEDVLATLRAAVETYRLTGQIRPVLAAQADANAADAILSRVRYGARGIHTDPNPETRKALFDQPYESRKLISPEDARATGGDVVRMTVREFPYNSFYGTYVEAAQAPAALLQAEEALEEQPAESEASVRQRLRDGRMARIFYDDSDGPNGYLSPFWGVEFTLDTTNYYTAYQAYEAERAKEAGNDALRQKLMGTRAARTIRFYTKKFTTQPKDPKGLWLRIFTALYQQHPELKERLLATGTDALLFADSAGGSAGIGLAPGDAAVLQPARWKGENLVGLTLETLRMQFREGTAKEAPKGDATESVITEEEQAAARTGAIIAQKRKFPRAAV